jgi:hypothetical protein
MLIYSAVGGYADVSSSEADDLIKKGGWFAEGTPGFVDRAAFKKRSQPQALVPEPEKSIVEEQPAPTRRIGRPRRGSILDDLG